MDIYDKNEKTVKLTVSGKTETFIDLGIGVGGCIMIGGLVPASLDGEMFGRAQGTIEVEAGPGIQLYPEIDWAGSASAYAGVYMGLGLQADFSSKLLLKYKKHNITGFDFSKHWEHMFWEKNWSTSNFYGKVYVADGDADNDNNAVIEGAKVTLRKKDTGKSWSATTNDEGFYEIKSIPDGEYTMTVTKAGYDTHTDDRVIFPGNRNTSSF